MSVVWFFLIVSLAFVAGALFGATLFHDWLHGTKQPKQEQPRYVFPAASIVSMAEWRKLDLPPMRRRRVIDVID